MAELVNGDRERARAGEAAENFTTSDWQVFDRDPAPRPAMTEAQWQSIVVSIAEHYRWELYHTHDSRRSNAGFPDLMLAKPGRLLAVELKRDRPAGRAPTPEQRKWLQLLQLVAGIETAVWRPIDQARVLACLGPRGCRADVLEREPLSNGNGGRPTGAIVTYGL